MLDTYNRLIDRINDDFATPHLQIKKFNEGFYEDLQNFQTKDELLPFMWLVPNDVTANENSVSTYNCTVYFVDILEKDDSNQRDVLSDMLSVSRDFVNWLRLNQTNGFNIIGEPVSTPFKSNFLDYCAGWFIDIEIEVETEGSDCSIPFSGTQSSSPIVCEPVDVYFEGSLISSPLSGTDFEIIVVDDTGTPTGTLTSAGLTNSVIEVTCDPVTVNMNASEFIGDPPAGSTFQIELTNTDGSTVGGVTGTSSSIGTVLVDDSIIDNSSGSWSYSVPAEVDYELPDETLVFTDALGVTLSIATVSVYGPTAIDVTSFCENVNIQSTSASYTDTAASGSTYTISNVDWTDSDGATYSTEYSEPIVCTSNIISDPSSFADANALFLGDRGLTLVDGALDIWENQGSDGGDANAITSTNRIGLSMGLGVSGYRDLTPGNSTNFRNTGMNTATLTQWTFSGIMQITTGWNPERIGPSIGTINANNYPAVCWGGNGGFRLTQRVSGSATTTYWSRAAMGIDYYTPFHYTVIYDGTESVNADRLKLYVNGVFVASTTTPTHPTSVSNGNGSIWITSSTTTYSSYNRIGGFVGYWERLITPSELAEIQTWAEQIWNVTP